MPILNNKTKLGFKGEKPYYKKQTPNSTLHNSSSINGKPYVSGVQVSKLDIDDPSNLDKFKNIKGKKYLDNKFR